MEVQLESQRPAGQALELVDALFRRVPSRDFEVRLWDGTIWRADPARPARLTVIIRDPGVLRSLVLARDEAGLGEGYVAGRFDLEGDLEEVVPIAEALLTAPPPLNDKVRIYTAALRLPGEGSTQRRRWHSAPRLRGRRHSPDRDRAAVTYHYDASNEFYQLFLDERMVYSCAYFHSSDDSLAAAQARKLDYVCRKLRLQPGHRLLDIGCGWGALILHAASHYGVIAEGITLSEKQATLARDRIRAAGLQDRCTVRVMDYRELNDAESYDRIASVGMFEHVGEAGMDAYFRQAFRLLRPGGALLNHAIGRTPGNESAGTSFAERWVFPDHELLPIAHALRGAETVGFEVRDVENLREHYALTLRRWVRSLERRRDYAVRLVGEATWRAWRLVFASAAHQFAAGRMHLYQSLFVKRGAAGVAGVAAELGISPRPCRACHPRSCQLGIR